MAPPGGIIPVMHVSLYLFYMVLATGLFAWCLFLWLVRDSGVESEDRDGGDPDSKTGA